MYKFDLGPMVLKNAESILKDTAYDFLLEVKKQSPVKTGTFQSGNLMEEIQYNGDRMSITIANKVDYAMKVEKGWRKRPVNWHISDGSIYRSVGANVYQRSLENIKPRFYSKLGNLG